MTVAVPRMPAGWRVDPACASIRRQVDELDACGVKVVAWHRSGKLAIWQWRPLLSLLRTRHVDVLHAHKLGSALWAILFGRVLGVGAIVVHDHGASAWTERQRNLLYRYFVGRFASRVIVVSDPDAALMVHERGVPSSKVRIVVNGIDSVQPRGTDIRAELGIPPAAPLVTCVAMLRPEKGLDTFIAAIARLVESQPSLAAVIAGGPSVTHPHEPQRLRELVSRFNLEHTVRLVGTRTDVADIVKASNVVVNSSDYEGTPIAILEYMDSARPIVATAVGGTPHVLRDGKDAVLVPPAIQHASQQRSADSSTTTHTARRLPTLRSSDGVKGTPSIALPRLCVRSTRKSPRVLEDRRTHRGSVAEGPAATNQACDHASVSRASCDLDAMCGRRSECRSQATRALSPVVAAPRAVPRDSALGIRAPARTHVRRLTAFDGDRRTSGFVTVGRVRVGRAPARRAVHSHSTSATSHNPQVKSGPRETLLPH